MDDPGSSTYLTAALCLLLSSVFSGSEAALFSSDRIGLVSRFKGRKGVESALRLKDDPKPILSGILFGNTLVNILFASSVASIVLSLSGASRSVADFLSTVIATVLVVVVGEITPKLVARVDPEKYAIMLSPALMPLGLMLRPFSRGLEKVASVVSSRLPLVKARTEELSEASLLAAVDFVEAKGALRNDEKQMIYGIIESKDLQVTDVMTPRPRMIALQEERSAAEALNVMLECGFSRLPLFAGTRDNVTGIVNIKDLVAASGSRELVGSGYGVDGSRKLVGSGYGVDGSRELVGSGYGVDGSRELVGSSYLVDGLGDRLAKEFAASPYFVPESKRVSDLLREMKSLGIHMSIVVDEFDGVSGLVTLEDLLEEIVGEIADEHDGREVSPVILSDGAWQVPGRMTLTDLESFTGIEIDDNDCDTVAGVVMKNLDRVPVPGDSFTLDEPSLHFEVEAVNGPRIQAVLIRAREPVAVGEGAERG